MSIVNLEEGQNLKAEIEIEISNFSFQESLIDKHTIYTIRGKDKIGTFETQRRYKDFLALREVLYIKWPGCFIPGIPGRKMFQGNDVKTTTERTRFLQSFCNKIKQLSNLYYSQEFSQLFLRSKDKEIYKLFESMEKPTYAELIQKYQLNFIELQGRDIDASLNKKIEEFMERLKKNQIQLKSAKKYIKEVLQSQEQYNYSIDTMMNTQLPNYEKTFIQQYIKHQNELLLFNNSEIQEQLNSEYHQNIIFKRINARWLYDYIRQELKDCKAFHQCIKIKNDFEDQMKRLEQRQLELQQELANLNEGKTNFFKNIFNKQTPEQMKTHLNVLIQGNTNELENVKNLIDIIQAIIGFIEIDRFVEQKQNHYSYLIKKISEFEQAAIHEQISYWQYIQSQTEMLLQQINEKQKKIKKVTFQEEVHVNVEQIEQQEVDDENIEHIEQVQQEENMDPEQQQQEENNETEDIEQPQDQE